MLKEIVYWIYRFFYKLRRAQKRKDNNGKMDSVMVVSVCLFANVLTLLNLLNYYTSIDVLAYIPVTTRYELTSWICIIIIMAPFIAFVYKRYFAKEKFSNMIQEYAGVCGKIQETTKLGKFMGILLFHSDLGGIF